jgi:hypothetical protein
MADRIRTTFYLPVTRISERVAYLRTLDHIRSLQPRDGLQRSGVVVEGYTVSVDDPVVFGGLYWSPTRQEWLRDDIVLLIIDIRPDAVDREAIRELKSRIERFYSEEGADQEELYCTTETISLL